MVANSTGTLIVAGESGAFISINTGASWSALNSFPPGRLTLTSSGDFFVYGAGVWRFNPAQQRFDALRLGNALTAPSSAASVGIIRDMETNTSGTVLYLVVENKGIMRLPAALANTSSTNAQLTTATLRATTIFSSQATSIALHPATGRLYALLRSSLWVSDNDGTTWQQHHTPVSSTNAQMNTNSTARTTSFAETILAPSAQRLRVGTTRLLQYRGDAIFERNSPQGSQNLDSANNTLIPFLPKDISAMLERDEYTLYATQSGLWAERREDAHREGSLWSLDTAQLRARVRSVAQTPFSLSIAEGAEILDLQTSGSTIFALTTKGVFSATEETLGKANPFLAIPQKILRWRSCNDGLAANIDNFSVLHNGVQNSIITASAWLGGVASANASASTSLAWKSLYTPPLLVEADFLLLQLHNTPARSSVIFAQKFGREAHSILRSRPLDSLFASTTNSSTNSTNTVNTGLQRFFMESYRLPLGSVWLGSGTRNRSGSLANTRTQPILFLPDGTMIAFARDTTQSRLAPTHAISSKNGGIGWQREEIRRIPSNIALGNIRVAGSGILLGEDVAFRRSRLYRSDDGGISWFELGTGRVPEAWAVHPTSGTVLISGAPPLRSQNFGEGFEPVRGLPFRANARFEGATSFAFSTHSQTVVMLIRNLGLFYSENSGLNFLPSTFPENAPLGTPRFSSFSTLAVAPNGYFYALAQNAVWQSRDDGKSWQILAQGLNGISTGDLSLHRLQFDPLSNVYLSTSRGLFFLEQERKTPTKELAIAHESLPSMARGDEKLQKNILQAPTLHIAPNPASEQVRVQFFAKSKQICRVEIWSLRGELLKTVFAGILTKGVHEIWFGVGELPQGVYLCRVLQGEQDDNVEAALVQVVR